MAREDRITFGFEVESAHPWRRLKNFCRRYKFRGPHQDGPNNEINSPPFPWKQPIPALQILKIPLPYCARGNACGNHFHTRLRTTGSEVRAFAKHLYALNVALPKFLAGGILPRTNTTNDFRFQGSRLRWAGPWSRRMPIDSKGSVITYNTCCGTIENRACEASPLRCYVLHAVAIILWLEGVDLGSYVSVDWLNERWRLIASNAVGAWATTLPPQAPLRNWREILEFVEGKAPKYLRFPLLPLYRAVYIDGNPLRDVNDLKNALKTWKN